MILLPFAKRALFLGMVVYLIFDIDIDRDIDIDILMQIWSSGNVRVGKVYSAINNWNE